MVTYSLAILNQALTSSVSSLRERSLLWTQRTTADLFQEVMWKVSHTECIFSYFHISWKLYCMSIRDKNSRSDISHCLPFLQWVYREAWTPVHHSPTVCVNAFQGCHPLTNTFLATCIMWMHLVSMCPAFKTNLPPQRSCIYHSPLVFQCHLPNFSFLF